MAKTAAEYFQKLFADLTDRPQDAAETVAAFVSATKNVGIGLAKQHLGPVVKLGTTFVAATKEAIAVDAAQREAQDAITAVILRAIYAKNYYECIGLIRSHPLRWGVNEEIARRYEAALTSGDQVADNLDLLIAQGGVTAKMELEVVAATHRAEVKAYENARDSLAHRGWIDFDDKNIDLLLNFCENKWTESILKKLLELNANDVMDDIARRLQMYRAPRTKSLKAIYMEGGMDSKMILDYYKALREAVRDAPNDRPINLDVLAWSSKKPLYGALTLIDVR